MRNFQNYFKPKYFPSTLLFLTCSLADLAVSVVHWQINHSQSSVPQCTRVPNYPCSHAKVLTSQLYQGLLTLQHPTEKGSSWHERWYLLYSEKIDWEQRCHTNTIFNTGSLNPFAGHVTWWVKPCRMSWVTKMWGCSLWPWASLFL